MRVSEMDWEVDNSSFLTLRTAVFKDILSILCDKRAIFCARLKASNTNLRLQPLI